MLIINVAVQTVMIGHRRGEPKTIRCDGTVDVFICARVCNQVHCKCFSCDGAAASSLTSPLPMISRHYVRGYHFRTGFITRFDTMSKLMVDLLASSLAAFTAHSEIISLAGPAEFLC